MGDPKVDGGQLLTKPNTASTILAAAKTTKEFSMNDELSSQNQTSQKHVTDEEAFLKSLCDFWKPRQRRDLENRYQLGTMLNDTLGKRHRGFGSFKSYDARI